MKITGFFTSNPRRKYVDARIEVEGREYDAVLALNRVHKNQSHLIKTIQYGIPLIISSETGVIRLLPMKKLTKKELRAIHIRAAKFKSLFDSIV